MIIHIIHNENIYSKTDSKTDAVVTLNKQVDSEKSTAISLEPSPTNDDGEQKR